MVANKEWRQKSVHKNCLNTLERVALINMVEEQLGNKETLRVKLKSLDGCALLSRKMMHRPRGKAEWNELYKKGFSRQQSNLKGLPPSLFLFLPIASRSIPVFSRHVFLSGSILQRSFLSFSLFLIHFLLSFSPFPNPLSLALFRARFLSFLTPFFCEDKG